MVGGLSNYYYQIVIGKLNCARIQRYLFLGATSWHLLGFNSLNFYIDEIIQKSRLRTNSAYTNFKLFYLISKIPTNFYISDVACIILPSLKAHLVILYLRFYRTSLLELLKN